MVQFPTSSDDMGEVIPTPPLIPEAGLRLSVRTMQNMEAKVQDKATAISKKRNLEGNEPTHNSFKVLSNHEMMLRATKMGVLIPDNNFSSIAILRELERVRSEGEKKILATS